MSLNKTLNPLLGADSIQDGWIIVDWDANNQNIQTITPLKANGTLKTDAKENADLYEPVHVISNNVAV